MSAGKGREPALQPAQVTAGGLRGPRPGRKEQEAKENCSRLRDAAKRLTKKGRFGREYAEFGGHDESSDRRTGGREGKQSVGEDNFEGRVRTRAGELNPSGCSSHCRGGKGATPVASLQPS